MFQNFLLKKMLRAKGVPEAQIDMFAKMLEKNPQLFKTIAEEVQVRMKSGVDQQTASIDVMQKYRKELNELM